MLNGVRDVDIFSIFQRAADFWTYGAAAAGFLLSFASVWWYIRRRVLFAYRAVDAAQNLYGDDAAAVVAYWWLLKKNIAVLDLRQRLLESNLGLAIFVCNPEGDCEYVNEELGELFGLDKADCKGFGWLEAVIPVERKTVHENWVFSVKQEIPYECDYHVKNVRSGEIFLVLAKGYPVLKHDGEVLCYVGSVTRVQTEKTNKNEPS
mgnify:CR=1 FL=1